MSQELIVIERGSLAGIVQAVNAELADHDEHYLRRMSFNLHVYNPASERKYRATLLFESGAPALTAPFVVVGHEASYFEGNDGVGKAANDDIQANYGSAFVMQFYDWIPADVAVDDLHVMLLLTNASSAEGAAHYGH